MNATLQRRAASGVFAGGLSFVATFAQNILLVPLVLQFWSAETFGAWVAMTAGLTFLTLLDGGHTTYVGNLLNRQYVEDRAAFSSTLGSAIRFALLTGGVQVALGGVLCSGPWVYTVIGVDPAAGTQAPLALFVLVAGWISTGSVASVLVRLYVPTGHFTRSTYWAIAMSVARLLAVAGAAAVSDSLVVASAAFVAVTTLLTFAVVLDLRRLLPEFYPWWRSGSLAEGWGNFRKSIVLSATGALEGAANQGLTVLIGNRLGAAAIPVFTTQRTVANVCQQASTILLAPVLPDVVRYHVRAEHGKLRGLWAVAWLLGGTGVALGVVALLAIVEPLYGWWTHGKLGFDPALFAMLAFTVCLRGFGAPLTTLLSGINALGALSVLSAARAVLTVGGALAAVPWLGVVGAGLAVVAAEVACSVLLPIWLVRRRPDVPRVTLEGGVLVLPLLVLTATGVPLACFSATGHADPWVLGGGVLALLLLGVLQWRSLPADVQGRVLDVPAAFTRRFLPRSA